jgi:hypothetical protein
MKLVMDSVCRQENLPFWLRTSVLRGNSERNNLFHDMVVSPLVLMEIASIAGFKIQFKCFGVSFSCWAVIKLIVTL